ncbi:MAG: 23S rRNA (pseudouridine(1915)-N(3))-methyltransferase RlmH [Myxococcota bacterium]
MQVHVVAVGKVKERGVREAVDDYLGRIGRYARVRVAELKDGDDAEVTARFFKAIPDRSRVVALEVEGKALSSQGLAELVGRCEGEGVQSLVFLIGGSYGLPAAVRARADVELSLSRMTLPHRLARLLLAEQVYRAFTILRNEPYSH